MFKRIVSIALAGVLTVAMTACAGKPQPTELPTETTEPPVTQSPEEQKVEKILIIGNSHSGDTFWQLQQVFDAHYDGEVVLGYLYYSGCTVGQHVKFAYGDQRVYIYRRNFTNNPDGGRWVEYKDADMKTALLDQQWDTIVLQAGRADLDQTLNQTGRRLLEDYVNQHIPTPHRFMWNRTWSNPTYEPFYNGEWRVKAPVGLKEQLTLLYGFNPATQFAQGTELVKKNILPDDTYEKILSPGTAIMYCILEKGMEDLEIYRDYTHLNDFGRLIAAYAFYTQFTGQKVTEIKIDVIPAHLRSTRYIPEGDLVITQEMKDTILEAVNYAFDHPLEVPGQQ